jgi:hypothetical protein
VIYVLTGAKRKVVKRKEGRTEPNKNNNNDNNNNNNNKRSHHIMEPRVRANRTIRNNKPDSTIRGNEK